MARFDLNDSRRAEDTEKLKERCVLLVAVLGLSVTQLLGQNALTLEPRPDSPQKVFKALAGKHGFESDLEKDFDQFNESYEGCRHFGLSKSGIGHQRVTDLTFAKTREAYEFVERFWKKMIAVFRTVETPETFQMRDSDLINPFA